MLFHRFGTISHILASTELNFCKKKSEDLTQDQLIDKVSLLELENKIYRILMGIHKIRFLCIHRRNLKV